MAKTVTAFYDLSLSPPTYDFAYWLVRVEHYRQVAQADNVSVVIFRGQRLKTKRDLVFSAERRERRAWDLLLPMAKLLPCVKDVFISDKDERCEQKLSHNGLRQTIPPIFRSSEIAKSIVSKFLEDKSYPVTITIRQSDFQEVRNSNRIEWGRVAQWLKSLGYTPIIVPDTEALYLGLETGIEAVHYQPASFNPDIRLALYELSAVNFFTSNGPLMLALLSKASMYAFRQVFPQFKSCGEDHLRAIRACPEADWGENKKFHWLDDTCENVVREMEPILSKLQFRRQPQNDVFTARQYA